MNITSISNEKTLVYYDLAVKVERGDLVQSTDIEGRVYLVLDKHSDIHSNTPYLTLLSPEGATLSGSPELWYDMSKHGLKHGLADTWRPLLFSILPRAQ